MAQLKAKKLTDEHVLRLDMETLLRLPAFKRFLYRVIQAGGLFDAQTDGSDGRDRYRAGRRDLGLEILNMAEQGQPIPDVNSDGPLLTLIQVLLEETQKQPEEKSNATQSQPFDRTAGILDPDDAD